MTKKLISLVFLLGFVGSAYAISPRSEDDNVILHYNNTSIIASTDIVLVDLSDTDSFNTRYTGSITISRIKVVIDTIASSTGSVKIGVVNYSGPSTGSVSYFFECPFYNHGATTDIIVCDELYSPSFLRTKVTPSSTVDTNGSTPFIATSDTTSGSSLYQNDVNLPTSLAGNVGPAAGDVIFTLDKGNATSADLIIELFYHSDR